MSFQPGPRSNQSERDRGAGVNVKRSRGAVRVWKSFRGNEGRGSATPSLLLQRNLSAGQSCVIKKREDSSFHHYQRKVMKKTIGSEL
ncbi:uncharacterized protein LOC132398741 isoform X2 [Hypanus sabinus]|uniref:uncharacterized protein LOC132398741 isoform X2 n=1 Tax=Hypanus sabinus TaxID=79690 RepID=UPI0028C465F6|nr:uncharacterized protein LOC132398741 isoform X2 [Hypanus sabinus]